MAATHPCPLKFAAPAVIPATNATRSVWSVTLSGHGGLDKVKFVKAALPVRVRADLIELEVFYCGLNMMDNYLRLGIMKSEAFPAIMGSECTGVVRRVGSAVTDFKVGEPVLCLRIQGGLFRRLVHVPPRNCFRMPSSVSMVTAVGLGFNSLVAYLCLFWFGRLKEGQIVFMQSIAGGVGTAVVQLAKTVHNVKVLGTASKSKHARLLSLGVTKVFSPEDDYVEDILEEYPEGIDMAIVSSGGEYFEKCTYLLKTFGRLVTIGSNNSVTPYRPSCWLNIAKPTWASGNMTSGKPVRKNILVTGINAGEFLENTPQGAQCIMENIFRLHDLGKIKPVIEKYYPPSQVAEGLLRLNTRKNFGKNILLIRHD